MLFETEFVTYQGIYKKIQTEKLNVPTSEGRRTILSNHMPIIMPLEVGVIETNENGRLLHYAISDGMMYFENNKAIVVADVIEDIEKVDIKYYEEKLNKAKEKLAIARNDEDIKKATVQLTRATNVINAAKKNNN